MNITLKLVAGLLVSAGVYFVANDAAEYKPTDIITQYSVQEFLQKIENSDTLN